MCDATIYYSYHEETTLLPTYGNGGPLLFYKRFIDDGFIIWKPTVPYALTTHVCRECQSNLGPMNKKQIWICDKPDKVCMGWHILAAHPDMVAPAGSAVHAIHCDRVI